MKLYLIKTSVLILFSINLFSQEIDFKIELSGDVLINKQIELSDFISEFDSKLAGTNNVVLSGNLNQPSAVKIKFDSYSFILVFVDTSTIKIKLDKLPRYFYDYKITDGSASSKIFLEFITEFNPIAKNIVLSQNPTAGMDSINSTLSNIVINQLRKSSCPELNSLIIMSAKQVQSDFFLKNYFEVLKDQYKNIENFVNDYPVHSSLIKELFISVTQSIDTSLAFNSLNNEIIKCFRKNKKYILLDFWATWCKPCIDAIPDLRNIDNTFKNTKLISVGLLSKKENIKDVVISKKISWDVAFMSSSEEQSEVLKKFNINFYPTYILISNDGKVLLKKIGSGGLSEIEQYLKRQIE